MELYMHTDEELDGLIKLKYGDNGIDYNNGDVVDNCPLAREKLFRSWLLERRMWPQTTSPHIDRRFKQVELYLNMIVNELRSAKTYSSSYIPTPQYYGTTQNTGTWGQPYQTTYTAPPVLTNTSIPNPIII